MWNRSSFLIGMGLAWAVGIGSAFAATGDVLSVTAERVNLRAGPGDNATVRGQLVRGEQLLELRRDNNWIGVRNLTTGEEGWIFSGLVRHQQSSTLERNIPSAGFGDLSRDFDRMVGLIGQELGLSLVSRVEPGEGNALNVTMTSDWLRAGSAQEHMLGALAIYQMWKNHQNGRPVRVQLRAPDGKEYITVNEQGAEPVITMAQAG